jgi:hypothetical protein
MNGVKSFLLSYGSGQSRLAVRGGTITTRSATASPLTGAIFVPTDDSGRMLLSLPAASARGWYRSAIGPICTHTSRCTKCDFRLLPADGVVRNSRRRQCRSSAPCYR